MTGASWAFRPTIIPARKIAVNGSLAGNARKVRTMMCEGSYA
ncbi:MAG: hypothetical protein P8Y61_13290 [Gammaproteobacteria bacterium]